MSRLKLRPGQHLAYDLRLDLQDAPRDRLEAARRRLREAGLEIVTLDSERARDPAAAERIYALHNACRVRQPPAGARQPPITYRLWSWSFLPERGRDALPDAYFAASDNDAYVGLSAAVRLSVATGSRREPEVLFSAFTGVLSAYAGCGIGAAVKAETIVYALEHGYREMRTTVLAENVPMLRINESFGFRRYGESLQAYPLTAKGR